MPRRCTLFTSAQAGLFPYTPSIHTGTATGRTPLHVCLDLSKSESLGCASRAIGTAGPDPLEQNTAAAHRHAATMADNERQSFFDMVSEFAADTAGLEEGQQTGRLAVIMQPLPDQALGPGYLPAPPAVLHETTTRASAQTPTTRVPPACASYNRLNWHVWGQCCSYAGHVWWVCACDWHRCV